MSEETIEYESKEQLIERLKEKNVNGFAGVMFKQGEITVLFNINDIRTSDLSLARWAFNSTIDEILYGHMQKAEEQQE